MHYTSIKKTVGAAVVAGSIAVAAQAAPAAAAEVVYNVSNHTGGSHGLWVNDLYAGANRYFSFQGGGTLTVDEAADTAVLLAKAINPNGNVATISITYTNFAEELVAPFEYKQQGGAPYDPTVMDFFTDASGTIDIDGTVFSLNAADPLTGNTVFQYGLGANAKNANELGGSSWINIEGRQRHWDLNFNMTAVPEPATWAMMLLGFFAIGAGMRSRRNEEVTFNFAR